MINENFKKDLVAMIAFSSLDHCHAEDRHIHGKEVLKPATW